MTEEERGRERKATLKHNTLMVGMVLLLVYGLACAFMVALWLLVRWEVL